MFSSNSAGGRDSLFTTLANKIPNVIPVITPHAIRQITNHDELAGLFMELWAWKSEYSSFKLLSPNLGKRYVFIQSLYLTLYIYNNLEFPSEYILFKMSERNLDNCLCEDPLYRFR